MSLIFATQLTAAATAVLAIFAIITAWYARRAFLKQSQEVHAIERQVADGQELARQQADLLKVQSDQLDLQRRQFDEQRQVNANQAAVLGLQVKELRESLDQRQRDADERHRNQAAKVTAWFDHEMNPGGPVWGARIRNASDLSILDVRTFFHYIHETQPGGDWAPVVRGSTIEKIRVFPPQDTRFVEIPEQIRRQISDVSDETYAVSIEFTDAAGNRWERDPRGALSPRS